MGFLSYFLGLEAHLHFTGLFRNVKYAYEILLCAQLLDCKLVGSPMVVAQHLFSTGFGFDGPSLYRFLVGVLQYLTITRPGTAHAITAVCQFMHKPSVAHFQAVKRILRYIKGTFWFGLSLTASSSQALLAYLDADWDGFPDTRRSISGYAIYFSDNLVS
jgi:hypothetical protein